MTTCTFCKTIYYALLTNVSIKKEQLLDRKEYSGNEKLCGSTQKSL